MGHNQSRLRRGDRRLGSARREPLAPSVRLNLTEKDVFAPLMIGRSKRNRGADPLPVFQGFHGLDETLGVQILSRPPESFNERLGKRNPGSIKSRPPLFGLIFLMPSAVFDHQEMIRIRGFSEVGMDH